MNFEFKETAISDLKIIAPRLFKDERGFFYETYKLSSFIRAGITESVVQSNQSFSTLGVVRGLHFQHGENAQSKLVRCIQGEIYDVAVDLRRSSSTFGKTFGVKLSQENRLMLFIPVGFAHGFSVLSEVAEVAYDVSAEYDPKAEGGIRFDDPDLAIDWQVKLPIVSAKDLVLPPLKDLKIFF